MVINLFSLYVSQLLVNSRMVSSPDEPMNPTSTANDTDFYSRDTYTTTSDHCHQQPDQSNLPLLLQPSYARSKSIMSDELRHFRICLKWSALDHSTCIGKFISYSLFVFFTIIVPVFSSFFIHVPASASDDDPIAFNKLVQLPQSGLTFISFLTLSRFFRRYGLRQLLFLDGLQDDSPYVRRGYTRELDKAFRYLACILLPSFFVELAHKIIFFSTVKISLPHISPGFPLNSIVFLLLFLSWIYRTGVFLLVCVLFRLTCELQILRFEGVHNLLEGCGSDAGVIFKEHTRIRKQLWATSHRYRFFIIGCLVTITVSQLGALLLVLASKAEKTFFNSGDLIVCSAVQLSGFFLCLMGAARITHRAQGIVSRATRWHMLVTNACNGLERWKEDNTPQAVVGLCESDSDSSDIYVSISQQEPSSSFQTRQALVTYLQHNNGGITIYGFALDRGLLHTLFAFETSLVLWILSKVVVLP